MSNRTFVIGVGMTKFEKPGTKEGDYPDWAKEAGEKALADAGISLRRRRAGLRRLLLRRLDLRPAGALPARPDRDPGGQRQQQLLDRLLGAVPGPPGGQGRPRRLRARARLREDGAGLARRQVHRPHQRARQARDADVRDPRPRAVAAGAADVRQRRPRPHGEVRLQPRPLRLDRLEEPQALGQQPLRPVPGRVHDRGHQGGEDDPRPADQAAVLADLRRLGLRDRRLRALRRRARPRRPGDRDRRPVDGHRPLLDLRRGHRLHEDRRLRHVEAGGATRPTRRLASPPTRSTSASCTTASAPTSSSPTKRSASRPRARATSWSRKRPPPTAARSSSTPPAG